MPSQQDPKSARCVPDPFLLLGVGSGDETRLVSSPDPTPKKEEEGLVTFERFLGSCKLSILTFAKANQIAAPRFSCDLASGRAATIVQCQLAV